MFMYPTCSGNVTLGSDCSEFTCSVFVGLGNMDFQSDAVNLELLAREYFNRLGSNVNSQIAQLRA